MMGNGDASNSTNNKLKQRGALIVFEGGDRAGKSSQVERLAAHLTNSGVACRVLRFPDRTTPTGQLINAYLQGSTPMNDQAIHLLFSANRWEAIEGMRKGLLDGVTYIVDRYAYSGVAYTAAKGGATLDWLKGPDRGLLTPDLVLYLDLLPKDAASRGGYGEERYENIEFQEQVRSMFLALKAKEPSWIWMDANRDRDSIAMDVQQVALETIQKAAQLPLLENLWL